MKASPAVSEIVLNLQEIARLAEHQPPIAYKIGDNPIRVRFQPDITPRLIIGAMLDLINGKEAQHGGDPPEAAEFLPRGTRRP